MAEAAALSIVARQWILTFDGGLYEEAARGHSRGGFVVHQGQVSRVVCGQLRTLTLALVTGLVAVRVHLQQETLHS